MTATKKQDLLSIISDNGVDIEWRNKILWMRRSSPVVEVLNEPIGVKLKDYSTKGEALQAGLTKLGLIEA